MKRIILKLSGEALFNEEDKKYDDALIKNVASQVKTLQEQGFLVGVVIGGGNYWRGRTGDMIDRCKSDQIGMLATVMNSIYVSEIFRNVGLSTKILTPYAYGTMTEVFSKDLALNYLEKNVVFFAGGTGYPYFSTDTAIALRAAELSVSAILLAKNVDGVYDKDPLRYEDAKKYETLHIEDVVAKKLGVIDMTASVMCMENKIELYIFSLKEENSIANVFSEKFNGTKVLVD